MKKTSTGARLTSAVMACVLALSMCGIPALAFADNAESVDGYSGSGVTELTVQSLAVAGTEYPGTIDPDSNPDTTPADGLGDNLAFKVPTKINFVSKANGDLVAPSASATYLENYSVYDVHASSLKATANTGWTFVEDASTSGDDNAVDLQVQPGSDATAKISAHDYTTKKNFEGHYAAWNMGAGVDDYVKTADIALTDGKTYYTTENGSTFTEVVSPDVTNIEDYYEATTAITDRVQMTMTGGIKNVNKDIVSSAATFGTLNWYVTVGEGKDVAHPSMLSHTSSYTGTERVNFRSSASFDTFENVTVDGSVVDSSNYTAVSGSTDVTFKDAYMMTLGNADHTVAINSSVGSVSSDINVNVAKLGNQTVTVNDDAIVSGESYDLVKADNGAVAATSTASKDDQVVFEGVTLVEDIDYAVTEEDAVTEGSSVAEQGVTAVSTFESDNSFVSGGGVVGDEIVTWDSQKVVDVWTNGTDAELASLQASYYSGAVDGVNLSGLIGEKRVVSIPVADSSGKLSMKDMDIVVTAVNYNTIEGDGITDKAMITWQTVNLVEYYTDNCAHHTTGTNVGGWDQSDIRTYLNGTYLNTLKSNNSTFASLLKKVKVSTGDGNKLSTATPSGDTLFLPSWKEVFGLENNIAADEVSATSQWEYFKTQSNRVKKQHNNSNERGWWTRSPVSSNTTNFCAVGSDGTALSGSAIANALNGLAPCGCI